MQAVILAGGLGTRLWPITRDIPKPMVPVAGKPYLEHQISLLGRQSIDDIVLLTGYLGDQIEDHFGDGSRFGLRIRYSRESQPIGTGGALRLARPLLDDDFLVIYGDSYLPMEYRTVVDDLHASGALGVVVAYRDRSGETNVPPNIALDNDGWVARYEKGATPDSELVYIDAGVLALNRSVLDLMPADGPVSLEQQIFPQLIARRILHGMPVDQRFYDAGTPERLRVIEEFLR